MKTCVVDLTDPGDLDELEQMAAAAEPDLLVNNAGFAGYREFCDVGQRLARASAKQRGITSPDGTGRAGQP